MSTARPFAYNPGGPISGTIQVGDLAVGTPTDGFTNSPVFWNGPDEEQGYVIAIPVPDNTQPTPMPGVFASIKFIGTKNQSNPFDDSTFITLANQYFNKDFTGATQASTWLTTNGYWNSYTGILVPTNGLTLYVDAGINLSYSGSGDQWYDLSGNNNTGTLQNSPIYSSSDGGVLTFNGSQYISFSSPTNIPIGNSNYTISVWFNTNTLGGNGFVGWGNWGSGNQVNAIRLGGSNILNYWWGNDLAAAASITTNTWYNAVARFDGTNRQIWVNNVMVGQDTPGSGHNVPNANNMRIGSTNNGEYFNGKISNVGIYDRALSDSEIGDIFNNLKSRFGL